MVKRKERGTKLMPTGEMVNNMDVLYHVKRKSEEENQEAIRYMNELIKLIQESGLEEVYLSPTELIINAVFYYKNNTEKIESEVDRNICKIICKLGYISEDRAQM